MSTTIDNRVLEMRFDNKQFENGVATSMSTLDKLKQKLNLSGASKGLNEVSAAAKNFKMDGMGSAIDTVHAKFSALQVMGVTALANITNSAVNAGKRMVSALTIDPIKTGFQEYETQINAVQTIMANVGHKGKTLDDVNAALDELNKYADQTIYNFTEMTRNIGLFTNAGVGLDESVAAIKGFSNAAAMAGTDATRTSQAMYQLSQAMSTGKVQVTDWRSLEQANITGERFQETIKETARAHGIAIDAMIKENGSFRDTLREGWLTADLMSEALNHYTLSTETMTEAEQEAARAKMKSNGYTDEQIDKLFELGTEATKAATKVKTFSQLWGVMQEAAQSGWSKTWQIIIGDFEEAKALLTPLADFFTGAIGKISDARNKILEGALGSPFGKLIEQVSGFTKTAKGTVETVKDLGDIVDKVIRGDLGNGQERFNKLTEAGYNWMEVQNKVNEAVGNSHRYTQDEIEAQDQLLKTKKKIIDGEEKTLGQLAKMSDAKLKDAGMTEEQIKALRELEKQAAKSGVSIDEFVKGYEGLDGRTMLIETFKNAGQGLVTVCKAIKDAWRQAFWGDASEDEILQKKAEKLHNLIETIYEFSQKLKMSDDTADKVMRTFRGLFSIFSLISKVAGGGLRIAFNILKQVLAAFDMDILDLTANIGDAIYKFNEWIENNNLITKGVKKVVPFIVKMAKAIGDWIAKFKELPFVQKTIDKISGAFEKLGSLSFDDILDGLHKLKETVKSTFSKLFDGVGEDTIAGLIDGFKAGIGKAVSLIMEIGEKIINAIKGVLGIHSPSKVFFAIGAAIISGLILGLLSKIPEVGDTLSGIGEKCAEILSKIDWGKVFAGGSIIGMIYTAKKMADAVEMIASPLGGLGDLLSGVGDVLSKSAGAIKKVIKNFALIEKSFSKVMKSFAFKTRAEGIKELAIAIAIIAGAVVVLSLIDTKKLWNSVGVIAALAAILVALSFATSKMSTASVMIGKDAGGIKVLTSGLMGIASALLILAYVVKIVGSLSPEQAKQGFIGLAGLVAAIAGVMLAFWGLSKLCKGSTADFGAMGSSLLKMSLAMLLMVGVVKLAGSLTADQAWKGAAFVAAFSVFVLAIAGISRLLKGNEIKQLGGLVLKLSIAMLLLVGVVKLIGMLEWKEMGKGAAFAGAFLIFVGALTLIARVAGAGTMGKLGGLLLSITVSMALMVGVIKLINTLSIGEVAKGIAFAALFTAFVWALTKVTTIGNDQQTAKMAATILAMSVAIGILAGICILLSMIDLPSLIKGLAAVGILGAIMTAMIWATRGANECKGNIIAMSVAIGIMAAAIAVLSFIDPTALAGATAAMGVLMLIFTLMVAVAGKAQASMGPLIVMGVVVALFGTILYLLADLPIESTLGVAAAMSIMLLAMAGTFAILGTFGGLAVTAIAGAAGMMAVIAIVGAVALAIGGLMSLIPQDKLDEWKTGLQNFMDFIVILARGLGEALGAFIGGALDGIMSGLPGIADSLSSFMDRLTPFLNGIKMVDGSVLEGAGILAATIIALTVADLIAGIASFVSSGSSFADLGTQLSQFFINSIPFITGMSTIDPSIIESAKSLAEMILILTAADLISGITSFLGLGSGSMSEFSATLVPFGEAICAFSNTIMSNGGINAEAVNAAATAGKVMVELQKSIPKSGGWVQDILGESDMVKFSAGICAFGAAIVGFSKVVSAEGAINSEAITAAAEGGKALSSLQSSIPKTGGWAQAILGESDMIAFSDSICAFGKAITAFSKVVSAEGALDSTAIETATNAGALMTELQKSIPKSGGWAQEIMGEQDLATFGASIKAFGEAITEFSEHVNVDEDAVDQATMAGKMMADLQKAIPEDKWFDGKVQLDEFGEKIVEFGKGIKGYSDEVTDVDQSAVSSSIKSAETLVAIANKLVDLDTSGIEDFKPEKIGKAMAKYSDKVKDIDTGRVTSSVNSARKLASLIGSLASLDNSGVSKFTVASIGTSMKTYSASVNGINSGAVSSSISAAKKLASFINSLSNINTSGVSSFKSAVATLGTTDFKSLANSLKGIAASKFTSVGTNIAESISNGFKSKQAALKSTMTNTVTMALKSVTSKTEAFHKAGTVLSTKLVIGLKSQASKVKTTLTSAIGSAASAIRVYWGSFYTAGSWLGSGLVSGINSKKTAAYNAGYALGQAAVQGEKDGQDSESPSKLTIKAGKWLGEGLIIGMEKMGSAVYKTGHNLGDSAAKSLTSVVSRVSDMINSDIDTQPTIRPVLDLSDVRSGVGTMSGLLNMGSSVGVMANVGAINAMMSRRNQNGGNLEVVSAIEKLRKDLGNVGNTTYTVNGVTYDDGSAVSEAVKTLVRATVRERRI